MSVCRRLKYSQLFVRDDCRYTIGVCIKPRQQHRLAYVCMLNLHTLAWLPQMCPPPPSVSFSLDSKKREI